ncbi:MAG: hypothetical protein JRE23_03550 [Deltaproteobacteria bacterium]|nr:hypothetical protein [Deltaproteobacteria bacterium]
MKVKKAKQAKKRFIFIGGVPVFDYWIEVKKEEILEGTENRAIFMENKLFLPVGTILRGTLSDGGEIVINPLANSSLHEVGGHPYYHLEFGGKQSPSQDLSLTGELEAIKQEIREKYASKLIDEKIFEIKISAPIEINLGGNNKNIIAAMRHIYYSEGLLGKTEDIDFYHLFFADTTLPEWEKIVYEYNSFGVNFGKKKDVHISGLIPRKGYVITVHTAEGENYDRTILSNRTNEETIAPELLFKRYQDLGKMLRKDEKFIETDIILNSITNPEELRHILFLLQIAYGSNIPVYLCLSSTFLRCASKLTREGGYFSKREMRFFESGKEIIYRIILPYVKYMILNRDELLTLDPSMEVKGLEKTMQETARAMGHGRKSFSTEGGKLIVSDGKRGAKFAERLDKDLATEFLKKTDFNPNLEFNFLERILSVGDDNVLQFQTTLGAGDLFTGILIGLKVLGWDIGHAIRAAALGSQYFISSRQQPMLSDIYEMDYEHRLYGTFGNFRDMLIFHCSGEGDPTRYGTIVDKIIGIRTTQINHPFVEIVEKYLRSR